MELKFGKGFPYLSASSINAAVARYLLLNPSKRMSKRK
jgi:hypothetical protein